MEEDGVMEAYKKTKNSNQMVDRHTSGTKLTEALI